MGVDDPETPRVDDLMRGENDDERKDLIKRLDSKLSGIDLDDEDVGKIANLGELKKSKSRIDRDMIE